MRLRGKVAIVTGASQGIGRDIAELFASEGASVALGARKKTQLDEVANSIVAKGGKAIGIGTDISKEEEVKNLVQKTVDAFGTVDILINNAAIAGPVAPIWEISLDKWQETIGINLTGTWLCCREVIKVMKEKNSGRIVNIGSISGKRPLLNRTPYCSSKLALVGLTRTLALEAAPFNINVNNISPGGVLSPRLDELAKAQGIPREELVAQVASWSPLKRLSTGSDVARVALFLCLEDSSNMTGQDINVSAGVVMY